MSERVTPYLYEKTILEFSMKEFQKICDRILEEDEVRFAGLINKFGVLSAGGFKQGIDQRLTEKQQKEVFRELAARIEKRKKYDEELGHVKYSASRRQHVVIMSFPIFENAVMVVTDPNVNIDRLAFRIIDILGKQWHEFYGE